VQQVFLRKSRRDILRISVLLLLGFPCRLF